MDERQQKLNDTRMMLNWLEAHPNVPLPYAVDHNDFSIVALNSKEEAVSLAKEFGSCEKKYSDEWLRIVKRFGRIDLSAMFARDQVCERIVVGSEVVPEQVFPEHVREVVEWRCDPILESEVA